MCKSGKLLEEEVDSWDGDLFAIREVDALDRIMALFAKTHDGLVCKVDDLETETSVDNGREGRTTSSP
jgi:hypothetical protein